MRTREVIREGLGIRHKELNTMITQFKEGDDR